MLKALIRFIFFTSIGSFIRGLEFIIFDKEEIISTGFTVQDQYNKRLEERRILIEYLENCRRQIYKKRERKSE